MTQSTLEIPLIEHPIWRDLVMGQKKIQLDFLATKILLIRILVDLTAAPTPEAIQKSQEELRQMFVKNISNPRVQNDLRRVNKECAG